MKIISNQEIRELILSSCKDLWAFWLDSIKSDLAKFNENIQKLDKSLKFLLNKFDNIVVPEQAFNLINEPSNLVKFGKCYMKEKHFDDAIRIFDRVVKNEPQFCESALYYKSVAILNKDKNMSAENKNLLIDSLINAEKLLEERILRNTGFISIINELGLERRMKSECLVSVDTYQKQKQKINQIYNFFIQSIREMLGLEITAIELKSGDFNEQQAIHFYEYLIEKNVLVEKKVNKNIDGIKLGRIAENYGISKNKLMDGLHQNPILDKKGIKSFKNYLNLPDRQKFWSYLLSNNVLIDEIKFAEYMQEENEFDFVQTLNDERVQRSIETRLKNCIYLFDSENENKNKFVITYERAKDLINLKLNKQIFLNKEAEVNIDELEKLLSNGCLEFGSIDTQTFIDIYGLNTEESNEIFNILLDQNFIDSEGVLLNDDFANLDLKEFKAFSSEILSQINLKCVYRITLLQLLTKLKNSEEENFERSKPDGIFDLKLNTNPTNELIIDLMEEIFVKPVHLNNKMTKKECVQNLTSINEFKKSEIIQNCQISQFEEFFKNLIECKFIEPIGSSEDKYRFVVANNYIPESNLLKNYMKFFKKRIDENYLKSLVENLSQLGGGLNKYDKPKGTMKNIEVCPVLIENINENPEEVNQFRINHFDDIIIINENVNDTSYNCMACFILGVTQISFGVLIEAYSVGSGTFVAAGLIEEGINDIVYAVRSYRTGNFDWSDYRNQKLRSVAMTTLKCSLGAVLANSAAYSYFGSKIVGNTGSALNKTCGSALFKATGSANMYSMMGKRICSRVGFGVLSSMQEIAVDEMNQRLLTKICDYISGILLKNIEEAIGRSQLGQTIQNIYNRFGKIETETLMVGFSKKVLEEMDNSSLDHHHPYYQNILFQAFNAIIDGIKLGNDKKHLDLSLDKSPSKNYCISSNNTMYKKIKLYTNGLLALQKFGISIYDISRIQTTFINKMLHQLNAEILIPSLSEGVTNSKNAELAFDEHEFSAMKYEIISNFKEVFSKKLNNKMKNEILIPLLQKVMSISVRCIEAETKKYLRNKNDERARHRFNELKQQLIKTKNQWDSTEESFQSSDNEKIVREINLLMAKSRNPDIVCDTMREGCCNNYLMLQTIANITGDTFYVCEADGITFPKEIKPLNEKNSNSKTKINFDCLKDKNFFKSIIRKDCIPNDCLSEQDFRDFIANKVKEDSTIKKIIENGYHEYYYSNDLKVEDSMRNNNKDNKIKIIGFEKKTNEKVKFESKEFINKQVLFSEFEDNISTQHQVMIAT
jgi:hypothetical protein